MATNLVRKLYGTARHAAIRAYTGYRALSDAVAQYQGQGEARTAAQAKERKVASAQRQKQVKSRVRAVKKVSRTVTTGSRIERANQLRSIRKDPRKRQTLRTRVKFYTT
jgi:hypothetical protein